MTEMPLRFSAVMPHAAASVVRDKASAESSGLDRSKNKATIAVCLCNVLALAGPG